MQEGEVFYPLLVRLCDQCYLAQLDEFVAPSEIFTEYSYFSSFSDSFVAHALSYVNKVVERFELGNQSKVFEVASNDGYLLQHFLPLGVPVLGIEPALNVAQAAREKGIDSVNVFLGEETARLIVKDHGTADLVAANNVMAHTPYLNDFVGGLGTLVGDKGVVTVEFPHLLRLIEGNQFDTIYHEHFSYFSFFTVERIFKSKGLRVFDVEELPTHGGSLRVYATNADEARYPLTPAVAKLHEDELAEGVTDVATYAAFAANVEKTKRDLLKLLIELRDEGKSIVAYGAPGKGNTLLNYCGIGTDFIEYMVDKNPYKQGNYTPGTRIPIVDPERVFETKPDYVLIMVWNITEEILLQMSEIRSWGGQFIVAIPEVKVLP